MDDQLCSEQQTMTAWKNNELSILASMRKKWNYKDLPINFKQLGILFSLALLVFWAQNGFTVDLNHTLFLFSNYFTWFLLLPTVSKQSLKILEVSRRGWVTVATSLMLIVSLHWIVSNILLTIVKLLIYGTQSLNEWNQLAEFLVPSIITRFIDVSLLVGVLSWLHQQRKITLQQVSELKYQQLLKEVELSSLKSQLNPHFLFNALHAVNSQIGFDDQNARKLIKDISAFLRKVLSLQQVSTHTLEEELHILQLYLNIEMERFSDRLTLVQNVSDEARQVEIPVMILQPLIENAFKHGVSLLSDPSTLEVSITKYEDHLRIYVANSTPTQTPRSEREGTGLSNLRNRLNWHYNRTVPFTHEQHGETFICKLLLPL